MTSKMGGRRGNDPYIFITERIHLRCHWNCGTRQGHYGWWLGNLHGLRRQGLCVARILALRWWTWRRMGEVLVIFCVIVHCALAALVLSLPQDLLSIRNILMQSGNLPPLHPAEFGGDPPSTVCPQELLPCTTRVPHWMKSVDEVWLHKSANQNLLHLSHLLTLWSIRPLVALLAETKTYILSNIYILLNKLKLSFQMVSVINLQNL